MREKPKKPRTSDYLLPQAYVTEWRYTITPPVGFQPKPLRQAVDLSLGPAKLTEQFSADKDGVVRATLRFDTGKRRLTAAESHELRDKVVQLLDEAPILIYFQPVGQMLLAEGKIREALKSYRDLIALHPKESVHHLQLAKLSWLLDWENRRAPKARLRSNWSPNRLWQKRRWQISLNMTLSGAGFVLAPTTPERKQPIARPSPLTPMTRLALPTSPFCSNTTAGDCATALALALRML